MNIPGFTAEASLGAPKGSVYKMVAAFNARGAAVHAAQFETGIGEETALLGTCAATTECAECQRICIPRFGCFGFQTCCCTTKGGNQKCFTRRC